MESVIQPIDKKLLKAELSKDKLLRNTNKANNEIYIITHHNSPNVMLEIGRLREIAFRYYGGGTGLSTDIDEYDTMENPYKQLIVWNPDAEEILGGYRFICGPDIRFDENGEPVLATSHLFHFSEKFNKEYLPYTFELGRSFVSLEYQSSKAGSKGIFALDNLWDGLGALSVADPSMKYFFGKVTMFDTYNHEARDMILYFMNKHFPDPDHLVRPKNAVKINTPERKLAKKFNEENLKADYKILNATIRKMGINIPPLVNAYMGLSPKMKVFGTAVNDGFGHVEETGILIAVDEILEEKKLRHIESYLKANPSKRFLKRLRKMINWSWKPKTYTNKRYNQMNRIYYDSPIGLLEIEEADNYICCLKIIDSIRKGIDNPSPVLLEAKKQLEEYFSGKRMEFNLPMKQKGTPFQQKAWEFLKTIPYAKTVSYKEEAEAVGIKKAYRAIGSANGRNNLPILIPCHRVINSNKKLGGYAYGLAIKEKLLEMEKEFAKKFQTG